MEVALQGLPPGGMAAWGRQEYPCPDTSQLHLPFNKHLSLTKAYAEATYRAAAERHTTTKLGYEASPEPEPPLQEDAYSAHSMDVGEVSTSTGSAGSPVSKWSSKVEEDLCLVCGDRASGYHYNALSCEGCKGFFRRSVVRNATYRCKYGGHCAMDMWMRRRCQACRLRRCREVGMKEECLLSEEQCKARDARRKARQSTVKRAAVCEEPAPEEASPAAPAVSPLKKIGTQERKLIETLVMLQDKYELPREDDVKKVTAVKISDCGRPADLYEAVYKQMAEMTILVTQLIVEFAKRLPGFSQVSREDQIILLKSSATEVMMLRTARRYDIETDTIVFANGMPYTRENMRFAGLHDYVDSMFHFCHGMGKLGVDNAEYGLLIAISILSGDRPGLSEPPLVERLREPYVDALLSYVNARREPNTGHLAKLLLKLTDLRTLSEEHNKVLFSIKVQRGSLPPLLAEYFDVAD